MLCNRVRRSTLKIQNKRLRFSLLPLKSILESGVVSVVICIIATAIPLKSIAKLDIVDSIRRDDC